MGAAFSVFSLDMITKLYESIIDHPLTDHPVNSLCPYQLVAIRSIQRLGSQEKAVGVRLKSEKIHL